MYGVDLVARWRQYLVFNNGYFQNLGLQPTEVNVSLVATVQPIVKWVSMLGRMPKKEKILFEAVALDVVFVVPSAQEAFLN